MLLGLPGRQLLERWLRSVLEGTWKLLVTLAIAVAVQVSAPAKADQIRYVYDEAGRLVQATSSDGSGTAYRYDEIGNILSVKRIVAGGVVISEFSPNSGPSGVQVSIYGSGFDEIAVNNTVTFSGAAATVLSATKTMLAVTVPSNATTGKISVTNAKGTATSSSDFVIAAVNGPTITSFTPAMGPMGTAITISGTNFSAQSAANKVKIGEYAAKVSSAGPTEVLTAAPTISASGKISVATSIGKAVSESDFFALPTGVSVADVVYTGRIVVGGSAQTVQIGTSGKKAILLFDASAKQKLVLLSSAGSLSLMMTVYGPDGRVAASSNIGNNNYFDFPALPTNGTYTMVLAASGSGKIDLQLNPVAPDITGPIEINGPALPIALGVRQRAMLTFNGTAGQHLGLGYVNVTTSPASQTIKYTVFKPDGGQLFTDYWSNSNSDNLPTLPVSGTYTIMVQSGTLATSSLSLLLSSDVEGTLVPDAAPLNVNITRIGQNARLKFDAVAGQHYWLKLRGGTFASSINVYIYKPDGSSLNTTSISTSQDFDMGVLPVSGAYTVWFNTTSTITGKVDVELVTVPDDFVSAIEVNGPALPISLGIRQRAMLTFNGNAGQYLGLGYVDVTTNPAGQSLNYTVLKPDGAQLFAVNASGNNSESLPILPVSGAYTIKVQSNTFATSSLSLLLSGDVEGTLVPDSAPLNVNITRIGQHGRLKFDGVAGQHYWLKLRGGTFPSAVSINIYKPDGSTLNSTSVSASRDFDMGVLPSSGTYTVWFNPPSTVTGKVDVELITVPDDIVSAIEINGPALPLSLSIRQRAVLTFDGTAGQNLGLGYANVTTNPAAQSISYTVLKPDGSQLFATNGYINTSDNLPALPVSGTYTIKVQSSTFATSSLSLLLSSDVQESLVPDAAPLNVNIARIGQNARLTFDGVAGQHYWLKLRGGTFPSAVNINIYKPDGSTLNSTSVSVSRDFDIGMLPASGTYTVWFNPTSTVTGKVDVELVAIPADSVGTIAIDGAAVPVDLVPGQRAVLSFAGMAGQYLGLGYTGVNTVPASTAVSFYVNKPDGTQFFFDDWASNSSNDLPILPTSGTYTVVVKAALPASASTHIWLSADLAGALVRNDPATTVPITRVGQNARLTFNGVAGQAYTVRFSGGTFPSSVNVKVVSPSGSSIGSTTVSSSGTLSFSALATTGTYTVFIGPTGTVTGQVNVQLQ